MQKTFIMLCGIPGSGKSTWIKNYIRMIQYNTNTENMPSYMILSTDDIIQDIADRHGLTYNDVFGDVTYAFAERMMHKLADIAFKKTDIVIWDQTNLNKKTRQRKMLRAPKDWFKMAIWFPVPDNLDDRLASRPGKSIPAHVIKGMKKSFTVPDFDEGFDCIWPGDKFLERANSYTKGS